MTETPASARRAASEVRTVYSRLRRRLREVADLGDLTPSQTSVLSRLSKDGPATASMLATLERIRPQSMAALVAALAERGLIDRTPDPTDGRRQQISLSEAGRQVVEGSRREREEWLAEALARDFTEAERQTVIEAMGLLDRLAGQ
ncbi:MarR family winged helix-turn-helix transcriptional regulator [Paractinoplanes durhamensis]|uniref:MarR family transcriptional regulator n=1 Tax=Paractinoplanes durhamensis TaxID=113563 RepID=A0ABQ3YY04_9ACTN|nr:MarR family transcriptional regulator [Actinoplanes durhamensis]GIE02436.1 MarR family transcriptional regulator [Actinoplanes durhamensis]